MDARMSRMSRMIDGAKHYAAADKSDPFALGRAMSHVQSGICGVNQDGSDAMYSADPYQEERITQDGKPYSITVYRNIRRP